MTLQVPLTRGLFALVDESDAPAVLAAGPWHAVADRAGRYYAARRNGLALQRLHAFLTGWTLVDHINHDGLDNRRTNLREATYAENARNRRLSSNSTSGFKGVSWHRHRARWSAYITADGRRRSLGYHETREGAARAYDAAALELHGEFAFLNFPLGGVR